MCRSNHLVNLAEFKYSMQSYYDLLFNYGKNQPRSVGSKGHLAFRDILIRIMMSLNLQPYNLQSNKFELPYVSIGCCNLTNIVGMFVGNNKYLRPILLGAHYDTVKNSPGADDNLAAIMIILDTMRMIIENREHPLERSIIVAFFDAEESPYFLTNLMGSVNFYSKQLIHDLHCAIILDLVGHDVPIKGFEDLVFITGMESNNTLEQILLKTPIENGLRILPTLNSYIGDRSDYYIFRKNNEPYLFFTNGRNEFYHTKKDISKHLNIAKMNCLSIYLTNICQSLSNTEIIKANTDYNTTSTELIFFNRVFCRVVNKFGLQNISCREDIDLIVGTLLSQFSIS